MFFTLMFLLFVDTTGVYSYSFNDINGNVVQLSDYQGKKILLVNTATQSEYADQYGRLEQLYQLYKDSLVIIAFPSNSFSHESLPDSLIKNFVVDNYNVHYVVASTVNVFSTDQHPLYSWLTQGSLNGMQDVTVTDDYFKFLIDKSGRLVGTFSSTEDPLGDAIQDAIKH